jgi:two-component system nitrogen regulation response regulator NtrX
LRKPLSLDRTLIVLKNAVEARRLRTENIEFKRQFSVGSVLTGESVPVKALRQQIRLMAPTNGRVLIYGESGTGKELIARAIHAESLRRDRVFVELNCAAIPEAHIEAELFGYRHGVQPGGPVEQRGTLERADGGTLFLDEVGDMSLKTQAKVLSALDDQLFTPGRRHAAPARRRPLIASTNKDLEEEIAKGNFREDLFYRLNVVPFLCRRSASASRIFRSGARVSRRVRPPIRPSAHGDRRRSPRHAGLNITGRAMCAS